MMSQQEDMGVSASPIALSSQAIEPASGLAPVGLQSADAGHTPGPWRVEEGTTLVWGACDPDDRSTYGMGYPVAQMERPRRWDGGGRPSIDAQIANAHLVAAAPELLEALKALTNEAWYHMTGGAGHIIDDARAAIAKAEGRP